ncbi:MAG: SDR family NAD(P)-dependent oxidoreductase [Dermatophilaceae bacterium]
MGRIVVAGAAGASGQAVVRALRAAGHDVVAVTRDDADLADAGAVTAYAKGVVAAGPVDGLVHLVGGWRGGGGVAGQSDADWDFLSTRVIDTLRHTSRAFFPALAAAGGRLVIVSTTGLDAPRASNANYLAAKGAAEAWTRALGHELGKAGGGAQVIRVMALYTDAELAANPGKDYGAWTHVDALGDQIAAVFA